MKFLYVYRGGNVPRDRMEENVNDWGSWMKELDLKGGLRTTEGKVVSATSVVDQEREITGVSIVEAKNLADAVKQAKGCPGLEYGGTVEVLEEFVM
jgi:hypothetical protein